MTAPYASEYWVVFEAFQEWRDQVPLLRAMDGLIGFLCGLCTQICMRHAEVLCCSAGIVCHIFTADWTCDGPLISDTIDDVFVSRVETSHGNAGYPIHESLPMCW